MHPSHPTGRAPLLSAVLPGAGQWWLGHRARGLAFALPALLGLAGVVVVVARGTIGLLELVVRPAWLWAIAIGNAVIAVTRVAAVADAWLLERTPGEPARLRRLIPAAVVLTLFLVPHAITHSYTVEALDLLDTVFVQAPAPLAEREAELLSEGVAPEDLGPVLAATTTTPATTTTTTATATVASTTEPPSTSTTIPAPSTTSAPTTTTTPEEGLAAALGEDRFTVLLAGGDFGPGRHDLRTDVMIVASLDLATGRAALIGVSRDLVNAPLPAAWSRFNTMLQVQDWHEGRAYDQAVEEAIAAGEDPPDREETDPCDCFMDRINYLHVLTANWVRTFPDAPDPGMEALRQTLEILLGIPIDAYVLVDFAGFVDLVDAIGGVTVHSTETMDIAFSPAKEGEDPVRIQITPGTHHLDGRAALAYVRNRTGSSDHTRMQRQRCMLRDLAAELDPPTLLRHFPEIARAIRNSTITTVPLELLPRIVTAIGRLGTSQIATLAISHPAHTRPELNYMDLPIVDAGRARAAVAALFARIDAGEPAGGTTECQ